MNVNRKSLKIIVSSLFVTQLAACSSGGSGDGGGDSPNADAIEWSSCAAAASFDCGSLTVPMNYSLPGGEQIDIAVTRLVASGSERQGSLLFNFGGPGGGGVDNLQLFVDEGLVPDDILAAYDLVSFDPRGVGESTPVDCFAQGAGTANNYPVNAEDVAQLHADYSLIAENCNAEYPDYLQQLGSLNVVRDMEQIRVALDEETLNFLGISYGTRLAALYLQEFPESSGRIVLDASMLPDPSLHQIFLKSLPKMEENLLAMLSLCAGTDPNCDAASLLDTLSERAVALKADGSTDSIGEFNLIGALAFELIDDAEFAQIISPPMVEYINTFDVTILEDFLRPFIGDAGIEEMKSDEPDEDDAAIIVETAVMCADDASRPDVGTLTNYLDEFNSVANFFAENALSAVAQCSGWPESLDPVAPIVTNTAPVSLVIGGASDAFTPLAWSEEMATQIGGVFIRSSHDGHGGVYVDKSNCVDDIVTAFFLDGMTPAVQECQ